MQDKGFITKIGLYSQSGRKGRKSSEELTVQTFVPKKSNHELDPVLVEKRKKVKEKTVIRSQRRRDSFRAM